MDNTGREKSGRGREEVLIKDKCACMCECTCLMCVCVCACGGKRIRRGLSSERLVPMACGVQRSTYL